MQSSANTRGHWTLAITLAIGLAIWPRWTSGQPTAGNERVCVSSQALNDKVNQEADLRCRLARTKADKLVACLAAERQAVGQANTYNGALGECRAERETAQAELVLEKVGRARDQDALRRRWPKWATYLVGAAALVIGAATGWTAAKVTK